VFFYRLRTCPHQSFQSHRGSTSLTSRANMKRQRAVARQQCRNGTSAATLCIASGSSLMIATVRALKRSMRGNSLDEVFTWAAISPNEWSCIGCPLWSHKRTFLDVGFSLNDVRFAPEGGHSAATCPLRATGYIERRYQPIGYDGLVEATAASLLHLESVDRCIVRVRTRFGGRRRNVARGYTSTRVGGGIYLRGRYSFGCSLRR
jgi:hypothetical protein